MMRITTYHSAVRATELSVVVPFILNVSLITTVILCLLLGVASIFHYTNLCSRHWLVFGALAYLIILRLVHRPSLEHYIAWLIILFYELVAASTLLLLGITSPTGLLAAGLALALPGLLIGARAMWPVAYSTLGLIGIIYYLQVVVSLKPQAEPLSEAITYWEVLWYVTLLGASALIAWLSYARLEASLARLQEVESALRAQKNNLRSELNKESAALRHTQLDQIHHLHKFALLGQSAAAILHELASHLSVLNLDIDDLRQHLNNSQLIENAQASISRINTMVHQSRQHLTSYDTIQTFNAISLINRAIKDIQAKYVAHRVELRKVYTPGLSFTLKGNPLAFTQVITVLLNNALDACHTVPSPIVTLLCETREALLSISVVDNGPGVPPPVKETLFQPITSHKSTGLGVGLYIARQLVESQFDGTIVLNDTAEGAHFTVTFPRTHKGRSDTEPPSSRSSQPLHGQHLNV